MTVCMSSSAAALTLATVTLAHMGSIVFTRAAQTATAAGSIRPAMDGTATPLAPRVQPAPMATSPTVSVTPSRCRTNDGLGGAPGRRAASRSAREGGTCRHRPFAGFARDDDGEGCKPGLSRGEQDFERGPIGGRRVEQESHRVVGRLLGVERSENRLEREHLERGPRARALDRGVESERSGQHVGHTRGSDEERRLRDGDQRDHVGRGRHSALGVDQSHSARGRSRCDRQESAGRARSRRRDSERRRGSRSGRSRGSRGRRRCGCVRRLAFERSGRLGIARKEARRHAQRERAGGMGDRANDSLRHRVLLLSERILRRNASPAPRTPSRASSRTLAPRPHTWRRTP